MIASMIRGMTMYPFPVFDIDRVARTVEREKITVLARGYGVMTGYFDDPAATAEVIDPEGWLHTGDLGEVDASGRLKIIGAALRLVSAGTAAERHGQGPE